MCVSRVCLSVVSVWKSSLCDERDERTERFSKHTTTGHLNSQHPQLRRSPRALTQHHMLDITAIQRARKTADSRPAKIISLLSAASCGDVGKVREILVESRIEKLNLAHPRYWETKSEQLSTSNRTVLESPISSALCQAPTPIEVGLAIADLCVEYGFPVHPGTLCDVMKSSTRRRSTAAIEWLIQRGVSIEFHYENVGNTSVPRPGSLRHPNMPPLFTVMFDPDPDPNLVNFLIERCGADPNRPFFTVARVPLHCCKKPSVAQVLLNHGADVGATDVQGATPLHRAVVYLKLVALLLRHGASPHRLSLMGKTPLSIARDRIEAHPNNDECVEILKVLETGGNLGAMWALCSVNELPRLGTSSAVRKLGRDMLQELAPMLIARVFPARLEGGEYVRRTVIGI